jgi:hypothetical protein
MIHLLVPHHNCLFIDISLNFTDLCLQMLLLVVQILWFGYCYFVSKHTCIPQGPHIQVSNSLRLSV